MEPFDEWSQLLWVIMKEIRIFISHFTDQFTFKQENLWVAKDHEVPPRDLISQAI